mgnify:CR=1 FL=1
MVHTVRIGLLYGTSNDLGRGTMKLRQCVFVARDLERSRASGVLPVLQVVERVVMSCLPPGGCRVDSPARGTSTNNSHAGALSALLVG